MSSIGRRKFIQASVVTGATALAAASHGSSLAAVMPGPGSSSATYTVKPLSFDPKSLAGISEKLIVSHYDNNYAGAVKRLNAITGQLAGLDFAAAPSFLINGLKREELIAMNSMILHEVYFASLAGAGGPKGKLADAIERDFGGLARWHAQFSAIGKAQGGGSGWTVLAYSTRDKRLINHWAADHTTTLAGGRPILVLDMFEHAYQMDYGAKAGAYVDAFMEMVNWENAGKAYDKARKET